MPPPWIHREALPGEHMNATRGSASSSRCRRDPPRSRSAGGCPVAVRSGAKKTPATCGPACAGGGQRRGVVGAQRPERALERQRRDRGAIRLRVDDVIAAAGSGADPRRRDPRSGIAGSTETSATPARPRERSRRRPGRAAPVRPCTRIDCRFPSLSDAGSESTASATAAVSTSRIAAVEPVELLVARARRHAGRARAARHAGSRPSRHSRCRRSPTGRPGRS